MARSVALVEAELEAARLEEALIAAKGTKDGASPELKAELRAARQAFRQLRAAEPADSARPDTIEASAETHDA